jgi:hypothetical protein
MNGCHSDKITKIGNEETCTCEYFDAFTGSCKAPQDTVDKNSRVGQSICHLKDDAIPRVEWERIVFKTKEAPKKEVVGTPTEEDEIDRLGKRLEEIILDLGIVL